jgi:hypothetical protein
MQAMSTGSIVTTNGYTGIRHGGEDFFAGANRRPIYPMQVLDFQSVSERSLALIPPSQWSRTCRISITSFSAAG